MKINKKIKFEDISTIPKDQPILLCYQLSNKNWVMHSAQWVTSDIKEKEGYYLSDHSEPIDFQNSLYTHFIILSKD